MHKSAKCHFSSRKCNLKSYQPGVAKINKINDNTNSLGGCEITGTLAYCWEEGKLVQPL